MSDKFLGDEDEGVATLQFLQQQRNQPREVFTIGGEEYEVFDVVVATGENYVANAEHEYASTQFNIIESFVLDELENLKDQIDVEDVVKWENKPHVTVRYGLLPGDDNVDRVQNILESVGEVYARITGLSIFDTEDADVLKLDVESFQLTELYERLREMDHVEKHPVYQPHITLAFLDKGMGAKYLGLDSPLLGRTVFLTEFVYSDENRNHTVMNAFCPTGEGGGIDMSCGSGKGAGSKAGDKGGGKAEGTKPSLWKRLLGAKKPEPPKEAPKLDPNDKGPIKDHILADKVLSHHAEQAISKLSNEHKQAITDYTGGKCYDLNKSMRSCPPDFKCVGGGDKAMMDKLHDAVDKTPPLPKPVQTMRGINIDDPKKLNDMMSAVMKAKDSGGSFQMPSFTSTTINPELKDNFGGNIAMTITAKNGLYVKSLSKYGKKEMELLMSPKSKFKVVDVASSNGKHASRLEEV